MSHQAARPDRAAASVADVRSGTERRHPVSVLEKLSTRLDYLIRDVSAGATSVRQHDARVAEAEAIAAGIRAVFRGEGKPVHPPLGTIAGTFVW